MLTQGKLDEGYMGIPCSRKLKCYPNKKFIKIKQVCSADRREGLGKPLMRSDCGGRKLGINPVRISPGPGSLLRLFGVQVWDFFLFADH